MGIYKNQIGQISISLITLMISLTLPISASEKHQKEATSKNTYKLGCWLDGTWIKPKYISSFDIVNLGMIGNINSTETGGGYNIENVKHPSFLNDDQTVLFTYGSSPDTTTPRTNRSAYPTTTMVSNLVAAVDNNSWAGIDFDDEVNLNVINIKDVMERVSKLKSNSIKGCSYTFIGGWIFSKNGKSSIRDNIEILHKSSFCERYILMCYSSRMWDNNTIHTFVPKGIKTALKLIGNENAKKIFIACTTMGLNSDNLNIFLEYIQKYKIGGLFIWMPGDLTESQMMQINTAFKLDRAKLRH